MKKISLVSTSIPHPITSRFGNTLPLTDAVGRFVKNAPGIVHAFMYFPNDPVTAWAFIETLDLMADDPRLGDFAGDEPMVATMFKKSILGAIQQGQIAGLVASVILAESPDDKPMSRRLAYYLAQKRIDEAGVRFGKRFPRDMTNIRNAFNRFESSAHLYLAMTTLPKEVWTSLESDEESFRKFLSAAVLIQAWMVSKPAMKDWRPWVIPPQFARPNDTLTISGLTESALRERLINGFCCAEMAA